MCHSMAIRWRSFDMEQVYSVFRSCERAVLPFIHGFQQSSWSAWFVYPDEQQRQKEFSRVHVAWRPHSRTVEQAVIAIMWLKPCELWRTFSCQIENKPGLTKHKMDTSIIPPLMIRSSSWFNNCHGFFFQVVHSFHPWLGLAALPRSRIAV